MIKADYISAAGVDVRPICDEPVHPLVLLVDPTQVWGESAHGLMSAVLYRHIIGDGTEHVMSIAPANPLEQFRWTPQPAAEQLLKQIIERFLERCPEASELRNRLHDEAGIRFFDVVDHIIVDEAEVTPQRLIECGFEGSLMLGGSYVHPGGIFPPIILSDRGSTVVMIKVESIAAFAAAHGGVIDTVGWPGDRVRTAMLSVNLGVVERHGYRGPTTQWPSIEDRLVRSVLENADAFRFRRRWFEDDTDGFSHAQNLIDAAIGKLGVDYTCDLFFAAERDYWQRRNDAAQFQKARQDRLGLGWANHDHHTYRSSRRHFSRLIGVFERLGFKCRERFYAGADAGWGAQILEQSETGVIIFADVDLSPQELSNDFAHDPLPPRQQLGTVGLWCALHGEAFLEAGMHHLECQFDFEALKQQMEQSGGIAVMKPFTDFPHLRQAFTEGQRWPVAEGRIAKLLDAGQITAEQAQQFRTQGAIGSHLENLERNQGFKGFNQTGVSDIIAKTDPRRHLKAS